MFNRQKEFVSLFLDSFKIPVANNLIRVSILSYDNDAKIIKDLNQGHTVTNIRGYVNAIMPKKDGASIGKLMELYSKSILPQTRNDALKVLVLFTDTTGFADKNMIRMAKQQMQEKNVEIIVVGAGNKARLADMITMTTYPKNIISDLTTKTFMNSYSKVMERIAKGESI